MASYDCRTLFLLPFDGSINKERRTRYFTIEDENDCLPRTTRRRQTYVTGDFDLIVRILKQKVGRVRCQKHPTCTSCGDAGGTPQQQQQQRLGIHACSFQIKDLIRILKGAGIERLNVGRIPDSVYPQLGQGLSEKHPSSLKILQCTGKEQISKPMISMVRDILISSSSTLVELDFAGSTFKKDNPDSIKILCDGLLQNTSLKVLNLKDCCLSAGFLANLVTSLTNQIPTITTTTTTLEKLHLSGNQIGAEAMGAIGGILQTNHCKLRYLDLSYNLNVVVSSLADALIQNQSLIELRLGWNLLIDCGVEYLAKALSQNTTLKILHLDGYEDTLGDYLITSSGFERLGEGLSLMKGLTYLDISHNRMSSSALNSIAKGLRKNKSLEHLRATCLHAGKHDLLLLLGALEENTTLRILDVSNNDLSTTSLESLSTLAKALTVNSTLEKIYLEDCEINNEGAILLGAQLCRWKGLKELHLKSNPLMDDHGAKALLEGLKGNVTLTILQEPASFDGTWETMWYYLRLNRGGRRLLHTNLLVSLWAMVLEKAKGDIDVIYHLLRQEILLTK